jgi:hypothetical protein
MTAVLAADYEPPKLSIEERRRGHDFFDVMKCGPQPVLKERVNNDKTGEITLDESVWSLEFPFEAISHPENCPYTSETWNNNSIRWENNYRGTVANRLRDSYIGKTDFGSMWSSKYAYKLDAAWIEDVKYYAPQLKKFKAYVDFKALSDPKLVTIRHNDPELLKAFSKIYEASHKIKTETGEADFWAGFDDADTDNCLESESYKKIISQFPSLIQSTYQAAFDVCDRAAFKNDFKYFEVKIAKNALANLPEIKNAADRRKIPEIVKAFSCGVEWKFDDELKLENCQLDESTKTKMLTVLDAIYFPYKTISVESPREKYIEFINAARNAVEEDAKYFAAEGRKKNILAFKKRSALMKSGKLPISSFEDAAIFYSDANGDIALMFDSAAQPLLKPDNSIRIFGPNPMSDIVEYDVNEQLRRIQLKYIPLVVDYQEADGTLRCKILNGSYEFFYVWLRLNNSSKFYGKNQLSIGSHLNVIGKYVENKKYTTLSGTKTAQVIEVLHYEPAN